MPWEGMWRACQIDSLHVETTFLLTLYSNMVCTRNRLRSEQPPSITKRIKRLLCPSIGVVCRPTIITVILIYQREKCVSETASNPHCPFARTHNSIELVTKADLRSNWQRENPNWAAANATDYDVTVADMFSAFWLAERMTGLCVWFVACLQCILSCDRYNAWKAQFRF